MKKHKNSNLSKKNMKTEICGGQNSQKKSPAASKIVNIFRVQNMKFIIVQFGLK